MAGNWRSVIREEIHARTCQERGREGGRNSLKMAGMTMAWTFCALGLLAYLEKSAMFRPKVA